MRSWMQYEKSFMMWLRSSRRRPSYIRGCLIIKLINGSILGSWIILQYSTIKQLYFTLTHKRSLPVHYPTHPIPLPFIYRYNSKSNVHPSPSPTNLPRPLLDPTQDPRLRLNPPARQTHQHLRPHEVSPRDQPLAVPNDNRYA
jgi:hypothetical protein